MRTAGFDGERSWIAGRLHTAADVAHAQVPGHAALRVRPEAALQQLAGLLRVHSAALWAHVSRHIVVLAPRVDDVVGKNEEPRQVHAVSSAAADPRAISAALVDDCRAIVALLEQGAVGLALVGLHSVIG